MRKPRLISLVLALALLAGCSHPVRIRFEPVASDSGLSCLQRCDASRDVTACMRRCPGAAVEPEKTCAMRKPGLREACYDRRDTDLSSFIGVSVAALLVAIPVAALLGRGGAQ